MTTSDAIDEIAMALAKAQLAMSSAKKDSQNPHFRSSYADLHSIREACMSALNTQGIGVIQSPRGITIDGQFCVELETRLVHSSGQWIADTLTVPVTKVDAQGVGSATTYARRYALASFAGIAPADDDGEGAVGRTSAPVPALSVPEGFLDWWADFQATADNGSEALKDAWGKSDKGYRNYATTAKRQDLATLKERARQADGAAS